MSDVMITHPLTEYVYDDKPYKYKISLQTLILIPIGLLATTPPRENFDLQPSF